MKKVYLLVFLLVGVSCQQNDEVDVPVNPYAAQIKFLYTLLTAEMDKMALNPGFSIVRTNSSKKEYRIGTEETIELKVPLSAEQVLSNNFINQVWDLESTAGIHSIVDRYESLVAASSLTENQKYELFSIGESVRVTAEFLDNGGRDLIYGHVVANLPPDEPIPVEATEVGGKGGSGESCIKVKGVMQGAVLSGFGGAVTGGYIGCTAGSFTIPVVGTATGCVGGAMFGFASGFFGGVISGLTQQVIFDCMLKRQDEYDFDPSKEYTTEEMKKYMEEAKKNAESLILYPAEG